jgi:hypothetical protein
MTSAAALGHADLRLRSRRVRSGRSHRLWAALVVATIGVAIGAGFLAASYLTERDEPVVDASTLDQQRVVADLRPIDAQVERTVAQEGLLVASYANRELDRNALQRQLGEVLAAYRAAAADLPPQRQAEGDALTQLTQSTIELSQAYDDGDQTRVASALAHTLEATARLHGFSDTGAKP